MPDAPDAVEAILKALHAAKELVSQAEDRLIEMVVEKNKQEQPKEEDDA